MECIDFVPDREKKRALVNAVIKLRFLLKRELFDCLWNC